MHKNVHKCQYTCNITQACTNRNIVTTYMQSNVYACKTHMHSKTYKNSLTYMHMVTPMHQHVCTNREKKIPHCNTHSSTRPKQHAHTVIHAPTHMHQHAQTNMQITISMHQQLLTNNHSSTLINMHQHEPTHMQEQTAHTTMYSRNNMQAHTHIHKQ